MKTSLRIFNYSETAIGFDCAKMEQLTMEEIFKQDRTIKRIEVYRRGDNESMWDEKRIHTFHAKDYK